MRSYIFLTRVVAYKVHRHRKKNKTFVYIYIYMLSIAGQKIFVDTHWWPGGVIDSTKKFLRATPGAQLDIWLEGG